MPRGGRRQGAPGRAYSNRSDLNGPQVLPPTAGPSQQYGQRAAQLAAQRAMPMASGPAAPSPAAGPAPDVRTEAQNFQMPQVTALDAPSERPGEPVTTGLAVGPGAGPEVLPGAPDDTIEQLRAVYRMFPTNDLRELIERAEMGL